MRKKVRPGFTTGAYAAAAAKAAATLLFTGRGVRDVEIPFPDGRRVMFRLHDGGYRTRDNIGYASVIKDGGDDPDVTNGAEIMAEAKLCHGGKGPGSNNPVILIKGGAGVGMLTKPGLSLPVGEAAINPIPRKMIQEAVLEVISRYRPQNPAREAPQGIADLRLPIADLEIANRKSKIQKEGATGYPGYPLVGGGVPVIEITISVPHGEELAKRTLNPRLGILGGISILGTTGIVNPVSAEAWTATITASMDVARAMGHTEVVLSAGRASEKAHMKKFNLPEESYIMMGDYLEFTLLEAKAKGFTTIHLCAQWAKMLKIAMATPHTHVKYGAIDMKKTVEYLNSLGIKITQNLQFNTAREIFYLINSTFVDPGSAFSKVCSGVKKYIETISSGMHVLVHLASYEGEVIASNE